MGANTKSLSMVLAELFTLCV